MDLAGSSRRRIKRKKSRAKRSSKADGNNTENLQGDESNESAAQDPAAQDSSRRRTEGKKSRAKRSSKADNLQCDKANEPLVAQVSPTAQDPVAQDSPAVQDSSRQRTERKKSWVKKASRADGNIIESLLGDDANEAAAQDPAAQDSSRQRTERRKSRVKKASKADGNSIESLLGDEANEPVAQDSPAAQDSSRRLSKRKKSRVRKASRADGNSIESLLSDEANDPAAQDSSRRRTKRKKSRVKKASKAYGNSIESLLGDEANEPAAQDSPVFKLTQIIPTITTWDVDSEQESCLSSNSFNASSCSSREYDCDESDRSVSSATTCRLLPNHVVSLQEESGEDDSSESDQEQFEHLPGAPGTSLKSEHNTSQMWSSSDKRLEDTEDRSHAEELLQECKAEWDRIHLLIKSSVQSRHKPAVSRRVYPGSDTSLGPGNRTPAESLLDSEAPASFHDYSVDKTRKSPKTWGSLSKDRTFFIEEASKSYLIDPNDSRRSLGDDERKLANTQILLSVRKLIKKMDQSTSRLRWLRAVRRVCEVLYISNTMAQRSYDISAIHPNFIDLGDSAVNVDTKEKSFLDRTLFKLGRKYGFNMLHDVEMTLRLEPEERTKHQINMLLHSLQLIPSFCQHPLRTQREIAKHAFFIRIKKKRVIVRQGHEALNYYFILNGQAIVTALVESEKGSFCRTYAILTTGDGFGEKAITEHSKRTLTVTSRSDVQLLTLTKEDYLRIFVPERFTDGIPDYVKYLAECSWMKRFPIEKILNNPKKCFARYFRYRTLIVADSTDNDWLYVIRNGRCQVLMLIESEKTSWRDLEPLWKKEINQSNKHLDVLEAQDKRRMKENRTPLPTSASDIRKRFLPSSVWRKLTILPGATHESLWEEHQKTQVASVLNRAIGSAPASRKVTEMRQHQQRRSMEGSASFRENNQVSSVVKITCPPASRKNTEESDLQQRKFSEDNQVPSVPNRAIKSAPASRTRTGKKNLQQRSFTEGFVSFSEDSLSAQMASSQSKSFRDGRGENRARKAAVHIRPASSAQNEDSPQSTTFLRSGTSLRTTTSLSASSSRKLTAGGLVPDFVKDPSYAPYSSCTSVVDDATEFAAEADLSMAVERLRKEMVFTDNALTTMRVDRRCGRAISLQSEIPVIYLNNKGDVVPEGNSSCNCNSGNYHINTKGNTNKDDSCNSKDSKSAYRNSKYCDSYKDSNSKDGARTHASTKGRAGSASNTNKGDQAGDSTFRKGHAATDSKNNTGRGGIKKTNSTRDSGISASAKWRAGSSFNSKGDEGKKIANTKGDAGTTTNKKGKAGRNTSNERDSSANKKEYAYSINNSNKQKAGSESIRNQGNRPIKGHASSDSRKGDEGANTKGHADKNSNDTGDAGDSGKNEDSGDSSDSTDSSSSRNTTHNRIYNRSNNHPKIKENDNKNNIVGTNSNRKIGRIQSETRWYKSIRGSQMNWKPEITPGHSPDSSTDDFSVDSDISESLPDLDRIRLSEPFDGARKNSQKATLDVSGSSGTRRPRRRYQPPEKKEEISSWAKRRMYTVPLECRPPTRCRSDTSKEDVKQVFVEMQSLGPGDVFGFDQITMPLCVKQKTHKVSLVSEGAEVILINKRFFVQHANVWVQHAVQGLTRAYPSPGEVQYTRRMHVAWEKYKERIQKDYNRCEVVFQPGPPLDPLADMGLIPDTR